MVDKVDTCLLNDTMSKRDQRKVVRRAAFLQIGAVVQAEELSYLFGDELCNLQYKDDCDWVEDLLVHVQKTVVNFISRQV